MHSISRKRLGFEADGIVSGDAHPHFPVLAARKPVVEAAEPLIDLAPHDHAGSHDSLLHGQALKRVRQHAARTQLQRGRRQLAPVLIDEHVPAERSSECRMQFEEPRHARIKARARAVVAVQQMYKPAMSAIEAGGEVPGDSHVAGLAKVAHATPTHGRHDCGRIVRREDRRPLQYALPRGQDPARGHFQESSGDTGCS